MTNSTQKILDAALASNTDDGPVVNSEQRDNATVSEKVTVPAKKMVVKERDNPGRGNCAFYAFAIGLIDIIQKEKPVHGDKRSPMFERWLELEPSLAHEYDNICAFNLYQFPQSPKDKALLDRLQMILRQITYQYRMAELRRRSAVSRFDSEYRPLSGTSSFIDFSSLYYDNGANANPLYNEFAASKGIKEAIAKLKKPAISLKDVLARKGIDLDQLESAIHQSIVDTLPVGEPIGDIKQQVSEAVLKQKKRAVAELLQDDNTLVIEGYEHLTFARLFLRLLYGFDVDVDSVTENTPFKSNSLVTAAVKRVTQNYFWGTHLDLDYLANAFRVNLHTMQNGRKTYENKGDLPERHNLTVDNKGNGHWTTFIELEEDRLPKPATNLVKKIFSRSGQQQPVATIMPVAKADTIPVPNSKHKAVVVPKEPVAHRLRTPKQTVKEINDVDVLQRVVADVVVDYCAYSSKIWFSIFHRHGETGRARSRAFLNKINGYDDLNQVKKAVVEYLEDERNGNTHPHSFRTMLLHKLMNSGLDDTLANTSQKYDIKLVQLRKELFIETEYPTISY